eukprot:s452_g7.t1
MTEGSIHLRLQVQMLACDSLLTGAAKDSGKSINHLGPSPNFWTQNTSPKRTWQAERGDAMCDSQCWCGLLKACRRAEKKSEKRAALPAAVMQDVDLGPFTLQIETWPSFRLGSSLWPSGFLLAEALATGAVPLPRPLAGSSVLELGAGPGLPGLAAARMGARVTLTDYSELVPLMKRNILHNQLEGAKATTLDWSQVSGSQLASELKRAPLDFILAADVVYFEEQDPLVDALKELMMPQTTLVLAYRERTPADRIYLEDVILPKMQATRLDFQTPARGSCEIYVGSWKEESKRDGNSSREPRSAETIMA